MRRSRHFFVWQGERRPHVPLPDGWRPPARESFRRFVQVDSDTHAKLARIANAKNVTLKTALELVLRSVLA